MYAAAGGASLASRQARQKQKQNRKAEKLQQLKNQKLAQVAGPQASTQQTSKPQSRPQQQQQQQQQQQHQELVKLSRVERGVLRPPPQQPGRRHSTSNHLREPQKARIKESPSILLPVQNHLPQTTLGQVPGTPGHHHLQHPTLLVPDCDKKLERRCSIIRQYEQETNEEPYPDRANHIAHFQAKEGTHYEDLDQEAAFGSLDYPFSECSQGRTAWQERERERRCSLFETAQNHRIRQSEAYHRWRKRNRIHDTTYGGSCEEEDFFDIIHQSAAANALLYVGLGTTAIGAIIFFVGTGEKGFKTLELRLIGPTLVAIGLLCCVIRVLLCACPSACVRRKKKTRLKDVCPHRYKGSTRRNYPPTEDFVMVDHNTSLLGKNKKRVSIAPNPVPCTSTDFQNQNVTTMFLQNEQDRAPAPVFRQPIPSIEVPEFADFKSEMTQISRDDSLIELQNLEISSFEVSSLSSCESENVTIVEAEVAKAPPSKLTSIRRPKLSSVSGKLATGNVAETSLSVTEEKPEQKSEQGGSAHSGIVLSALKLGQ